MDKNNKRTNWKTTDRRFVAFFDLLGFKDKVMRSSHEDIYAELHKISIIRKNLETSVNEEIIQENFKDADIYIVSFSDSIVLFSKNDSVDNFKFFTLSLIAIFSNAIKNKIAIKGAVAHGMVSLNKTEQIYFGQPIIDAYLLEEDVNFLGILCHNSIDKYLKNMKSSEFIDETYKFYETPLKYGSIKHYFIDYYHYIIDSKKKEESLESEEKYNNIINVFKDFYITVSGNPRRYIDNTIKFINKAKEQGKRI